MRDQCHAASQILGPDLTQISIAQQDASAHRLQESQQQVDQRGLAATIRADNGECLALTNLERNALQHRPLCLIVEVNVLKRDGQSSMLNAPFIPLCMGSHQLAQVWNDAIRGRSASWTEP